MSVIDGSVKGVSLVLGPSTGPGARKTYLVTANFATVTAGDTGQITGVQDRIQEHVRNGKTLTVRAAMGANPGTNSTGGAVYASPTITNSSGTLSFNLGSTTGVAEAATTPAAVGFLVMCDES